MLSYFSRQKTAANKWEHSSAGRASALQAEGHRFEPYCSHQKSTCICKCFFTFSLFSLPYSLFSSHSPRPAAHRTPAVPPHFLGTPEICSPQGRCAHMWQEPTVPPQTPRGLRPQTASPTAAAGIPLRSNVVGTCGSPTNAPSLFCGNAALADPK